MAAILAIRPGAIGDALLAFPALAALRTRRPNWTLTLVAHPAIGSLALAAEIADRFISRDSSESDSLFVESPSLARELLGPVDVALAWTADSQGVLNKNLLGLGASSVVIAPSQPGKGTRGHVAEHLIETLEPLGVRSSLSEWAGLRHLVGSHERPTTSGREPLVVVHPGSGSGSKNWPGEKFAALADLLHATLGARLVVGGGPAHETQLRILADLTSAPHELLVDAPLDRLAQLLSSSDLYVGNDSGISHLAGMSGAPTLALFGPTDPTMWRPLGARVKTLRQEPLAGLEVSTVVGAAGELLDPLHRYLLS